MQLIQSFFFSSVLFTVFKKSVSNGILWENVYKVKFCEDEFNYCCLRIYYVMYIQLLRFCEIARNNVSKNVFNYANTLKTKSSEI